MKLFKKIIKKIKKKISIVCPLAILPSAHHWWLQGARKQKLKAGATCRQLKCPSKVSMYIIVLNFGDVFSICIEMNWNVLPTVINTTAMLDCPKVLDSMMLSIT